MTTPNDTGSALQLAEADLLSNTAQTSPFGPQSDNEGNIIVCNQLQVAGRLLIGPNLTVPFGSPTSGLIFGAGQPLGTSFIPLGSIWMNGGIGFQVNPAPSLQSNTGFATLGFQQIDSSHCRLIVQTNSGPTTVLDNIPFS